MMNPILQAWNISGTSTAIAALLSCCAAHRWAEEVTTLRPYANEQALFATADEVWAAMREPDWIEAFRAHPRIGEYKPIQASIQSRKLSADEQASVHATDSEILAELASSNLSYEELFGFTYIVCATGKSTEEMLRILKSRLASDRQSELKEAAEQQRQIMQIRLRKWLQA